jgi:putative membrane protein
VQPALLAVASWVLIPTVWQIPPFVLAAVAGLTLLGPSILLLQISKWAFVDGTIKIIPLFRAFIYSWAVQHSEPLEEQLASVSEIATLEIDELTFTDPFEKVVGRLVAPYVHPGPFRNVGSSGLSLSLTQGLGMETIVVHGVSSHEKDLPRSSDVSRLVSALKLAEAHTRTESRACTPMTRAEVGGAKASCQIFGDTAFFTLTLAPKSHDDIPDAAKDRIREIATSRGLSAIVADAHNCLYEEDLLDDGDVDNLVAAALTALEMADKLPRSDFRIGVARLYPAEWGLNEGMGPCGIAASIVESGPTKNAYIVFDSNNMIQGMREEILSQVSSLGFEAEVMTSDTHLVNAIGATDRGYHPAGEVMDHAAVLRYVEELLGSVVMTPAVASLIHVSVDGVPIIGNKGIELLRGIVKTSFRIFMRTSAAVLPFSFLTALAVALLA